MFRRSSPFSCARRYAALLQRVMAMPADDEELPRDTAANPRPARENMPASGIAISGRLLIYQREDDLPALDLLRTGRRSGLL